MADTPQQPQSNPQAAPAPASPPSPVNPPQQQLPVDQSHYRNGRITRHGMEHVIRSGGSVIHNGKHITKIDDLPTSADLANTPEERAAARAQLESQQKQVNDQLAQLDAAETPGKHPRK
jgi:hypothetical protein